MAAQRRDVPVLGDPPETDGRYVQHQYFSATTSKPPEGSSVEISAGAPRLLRRIHMSARHRICVGSSALITSRRIFRCKARVSVDRWNNSNASPPVQFERRSQA